MTASMAERKVLNLSSNNNFHSGPGTEVARLDSISMIIAVPSGTDSQNSGRVVRSDPRSWAAVLDEADISRTNRLNP